MSRSGYVDSGECDDTADFLRMCAYQANVVRCLNGKKGQAFLWELYQALESLPRKTLITGALMDPEGTCCALGAVALQRRVTIPEDLRITEEGEPDDYDMQEEIGPFLGIKTILAREIMYYNDEHDDLHEIPGPPIKRSSHPTRDETEEERWLRMRAWTVSHLRNIP